MAKLRSGLFLFVFLGLSTIIAFASLIPLALRWRGGVLLIADGWSRLVNGLLKLILNVDHRIEGTENLPAGGAIIASKHQSLWDTSIVLSLFPNPAVVMKKELLSVPIYGWLCRAQDMIVVDRKGGAKALKKMYEEAREAAARGRKIIIFPQGTRTPPGEAAPYQPGIYAIYRETGLPCVPAAVNSGFFWPKRGTKRPNGTIRLKFLHAIPPGLKREEFMREMESRIEAAQASLEAETRAGLHIGDNPAQ